MTERPAAVALVLTAAGEDGEIALVRLLSLLPARWTYRHEAIASRITLWAVPAPPGRPGTDDARVRSAVREALRDPALGRWRLQPRGADGGVPAGPGAASAPSRPGETPSVTIRRAVAEDAERLTALIRESRACRGEYASVISGYRVDAGYLDRHRVFLAADTSGHLLGFYALVLEPPELDLAFVADEAQGRGVGRLLIAHMTEQAGRAGLTEVRVVSHPPAEGFYRSVGAERVGTVAPTPPEITWERPELRFTLRR
ncbi:GNAT family N-acetyltransferase [Streptomyces sp. NPDC059853]|uniref:GNAT family N-acetyltransferase n=1 Tax=Streptomyces sp. NPDC059853 TaxID=3346973 RepID=UPI003646EDFD